MPDFVFHMRLELWIAAGLTLFGLYPVLGHLMRGWKIKRADIITGLNQDSKKLYLETFQREQNVTLPDHEFEVFYNRRFGRWNYIFPTLALLVVLFPLSYVMGITALTQVNVLSPKSGADVFGILNALTPYLSLPAIAAAGIVGAYLWIVADLILSQQQLDLKPSDVMRAVLRLIIGAPLGYAIGSIVKADVAPFVAFAVGAFPLEQIGIAMRKLADKQLGLDLDVGGQPGQVTQLDGVDGPTAQKLREANVTTIAQLAYFDPVQLSMRTGFDFNFVLDIVGQALAWMYFGAMLNDIRPAGLRGSIEIANIWVKLYEDDHDLVEQAQHVVTDAAARAHITVPLFRNACREIAKDPANEFLMEVWAGGLSKISAAGRHKLALLRSIRYI